MEYKRLPQFTKAIDGRTVTGIFAVHGNVDDGRDVSEPGSFGKRLASGQRNRVRFLWNHDSWQPPIASIKSVREVARDELPAAVLSYAPDATGGVEVVREYYDDVPLAKWVFSAVEKGDITEMSYAYDVHDSDMVDRNGERVRLLRDVELFDISDVNWGMNPATAGVKNLVAAGTAMTYTEHARAVVATVESFVQRANDRKAFRQADGRDLSEQARTHLDQLAQQCDALLKSIRGLASPPTAEPADVLGVLAQYELVRYQLHQQGVKV